MWLLDHYSYDTRSLSNWVFHHSTLQVGFIATAKFSIYLQICHDMWIAKLLVLPSLMNSDLETTSHGGCEAGSKALSPAWHCILDIEAPD